MKLIDDKDFFETQINWFNKQIKELEIKNFKASGISEKDNMINDVLNGSIINDHHLASLRNLLSEIGIKKLSNAIASAKKRKNSKKESFQVMLKPKTISDLKEKAKQQNMSMTELIETILK